MDLFVNGQFGESVHSFDDEISRTNDPYKLSKLECNKAMALLGKYMDSCQWTLLVLTLCAVF
jgi:hypothetical protein